MFRPALWIVVFVFCCPLLVIPTRAQTPFLLALLEQPGVLQVQSGVTLTGTADWTAGSTQESGPATLTANIDGSYQTTLNLNTAARTESGTGLAARTCSWTDAASVIHPIKGGNCLMPVTWFSPLNALFLLKSSQIVVVDDGLVTDHSRSLHSISFHIAPPLGANDELVSLLASTSKVSILFDPTSLEPLVMTYSLHPDGDDVRGIPVRVELSDFRSLQGLSLPYHIDRYVNGTLQLSIQASSVSIQ